MKAFMKKAAPDYELVTRRGNDKSYAIQENQRLWFLVWKPLADRISPNLCRSLLGGRS